MLQEFPRRQIIKLESAWLLDLLLGGVLSGKRYYSNTCGI